MIGIVTVLYNSGPVLEEFFMTLDKQTYKDFVLYIIDNKSPDNSLEEASRLSKKVGFKCVIMPQEENWGVAKGNNIGIKAALKDKCEYVLLSNNDIVLEVDTIEKLFLGLKKEHADMAVPKIYYWNTDRIIWAAGGFWHLSDCTSRHFGYRLPDSSEYNIMQQVDYSPTCFMLINAEVFNRVGYMDENYFVYYDDADFVWRAVIKGREKLYYIPSSLLSHKESYSTGGSVSEFCIYYVNRNRIYFSYKHLSKSQRLIMYTYIIAHYFIRDLFRLNKEQLKTLRRGNLEGRKMVKRLNLI